MTALLFSSPCHHPGAFCSGLLWVHTHSVHTQAGPWAWARVLALRRAAALGTELRLPLPLLLSLLLGCGVLGVPRSGRPRATGPAEDSQRVLLARLSTSSFRYPLLVQVVLVTWELGREAGGLGLVGSVPGGS